MKFSEEASLKKLFLQKKDAEHSLEIFQKKEIQLNDEKNNLNNEIKNLNDENKNLKKIILEMKEVGLNVIEKNKKKVRYLQETVEFEHNRNKETVFDREKLVDVINEKIKDLENWRNVAYNLASTTVRTCASALTIPEYDMNKEFHSNCSSRHTSHKNHSHSHSPHSHSPHFPSSHSHSSQYSHQFSHEYSHSFFEKNSENFKNTPHTASTKEILNFLHVNNIRGNVLVSKELLSNILELSKVNI